MCREGAWAELTVEVTSVRPFRGAARVKKDHFRTSDSDVLFYSGACLKEHKKDILYGMYLICLFIETSHSHTICLFLIRSPFAQSLYLQSSATT